MKDQKTTFHRNGQVSVNAVIVGRCLGPDPSGPPHVRSMVWKFLAWDGPVEQQDTRGRLFWAAEGALRRMQAR